MADFPDLHPELKEYLYDHYMLGQILKHPLVFSIPYSPAMNEHLNRSLEVKKAEVDRCIQEKRFSRALWFYEKPFQMETLLSFAPFIEDHNEFWSLLGSVYTGVENVHEVRKALKLMLNCGRPNREQMMDEDERAILAKLPDEVVVFRGHQGVNMMGVSWTLSHLKALWFSRRYGDKVQKVSWGRVKRQDIIAFFHRRREMDCLIDPSNVRGMVNFKLPLVARKEPYNRIMEIATGAFKLPTKQTMHGPDHWCKVEYNGEAICDDTPLADRHVVQCFSLLHDCQRDNEHKDPEHGHRAANFLTENEELRKLVGLESIRLEKLLFALRYHNDGQVSDDPTIGACWDADRLDLTRVGYVPDPKMFSTKRGKELIFNI